jgi:hypothetical protein
MEQRTTEQNTERRQVSITALFFKARRLAIAGQLSACCYFAGFVALACIIPPGCFAPVGLLSACCYFTGVVALAFM